MRFCLPRHQDQECLAWWFAFAVSSRSTLILLLGNRDNIQCYSNTDVMCLRWRPRWWWRWLTQNYYTYFLHFRTTLNAAFLLSMRSDGKRETKKHTTRYTKHSHAINPHAQQQPTNTHNIYIILVYRGISTTRGTITDDDDDDDDGWDNDVASILYKSVGAVQKTRKRGELNRTTEPDEHYSTTSSPTDSKPLR